MYNHAHVIGHLGADPEVRHGKSGQFATMRVATTERWKDADGDAQERTEWHRIIVFGPQVETIGEYLKKGARVGVIGQLRTREWEDSEGNKRYSTEIVGRQVLFLDRAPKNAKTEDRPTKGKPTKGKPTKGKPTKPNREIEDDDIPF